MPVGGDLFLFYEYFTADGTFLSVGQTVLRTGSSYGWNDFGFMTRGGNGLACGIIASRAGDIIFPPALGAGGGLTCVLYIVVTERGNRAALLLAAAGAGENFLARLSTCRRGLYFVVCEIMTECGNYN